MILEEVSLSLAIPPETWDFAIENGIVVARPDLPFLFCLNQTAGLIWNAYRDTGSEENAADLLVERFGIPEETAAGDVLATLTAWADAGLLGPTKGVTPQQWNGLHGPVVATAYFSIEGTNFLLRTDSAELIAEVAPRLDAIGIGACTPDVTVDVWGADDGFAIVAGKEFVSIEQGVKAARAVLLQELVRLAQPERKWLALLHAGACGIRGRCVLFPAASCSGKSTLAAALAASGFELYSDDFLGVERDTLRIPPMPFAIALRRGWRNVLRSWIADIDRHIAPESADKELSFLPFSHPDVIAPADAAAIVFTQWADGVDVSLQRLSTADTIARLNESGFWVSHDRAGIAAFLAWLDRLPKFALRYGDLAEAISLIGGFLGGPFLRPNV